MVPSLYDGDDGGTRSVLGAILRDSTDVSMFQALSQRYLP